MVYVLDINGNPLMPTSRHGKVRRLLDDGKARAVRHVPFTVQLLYSVPGYVQDVTLGVDAGSKTVGVSVSTESKELYRSEVILRNDIVNLLSSRREARRTRRFRKTRYRKARFDNRTAAKKEGWLAPSVRQKVGSHVRIVNDICSFLPVRTIIVETAQFDMQRIKNPDISGEEYQHGEQDGFWNVREYVLFRDNHQCQHCHGKFGDNILNVHHLESRKTGGDRPDNLVTLCETCHKAYHRGEIKLNLRRKSQSLRDAAFMGIMRWSVYNELKACHPDKTVRMTYGYATKRKRIAHGIEKAHSADAFCIAGNMNAIRLSSPMLTGRCIARHTRSIHVFTPGKGGKRRSAVASHWISARKTKKNPEGNTRLQRFDLVRYKGKDCIIAGSTHGRPILRTIDWELATESASVNPKDVTFHSRKHSSIIYQYVENQQ